MEDIVDREYVTVNKDIVEEDLLCESIVNDIEEGDRITDDDTLSEFLEHILRALKEKKISEIDKQRLGEFYVGCKFNKDRKVRRGDYTEEDMIKFLFMGWFIYNMILKDKRF